MGILTTDQDDGLGSIEEELAGERPSDANALRSYAAKMVILGVGDMATMGTRAGGSLELWLSGSGCTIVRGLVDGVRPSAVGGVGIRCLKWFKQGDQAISNWPI